MIIKGPVAQKSGFLIMHRPWVGKKALPGVEKDLPIEKLAAFA
jgi:hypothetical protein